MANSLLLAAILLGGLFLRINGLHLNGIWTDEIFTQIFSAPHQRVAEVISHALSTPLPSPPLWFLLSYVVQRIFGEGIVQLRLLSVVFGVLGIFAIYKLGKLFFNRAIGIIAALLLAVSPAHIYFSREARFYPAIVFFSLFSFIFLWRGLQSNERKWWLGFVLATLLNLYTHLTASFVLLSEIVFVALVSFPDLKPLFRLDLRKFASTATFSFIVSILVVGLAFLPMTPFLLNGLGGERGAGSTEGVEGFDLSVDFFFDLVRVFGAGSGLPLSLFLGAAIVGVAASWSRYKRQLLLFAVTFIVPILIILILQPKHWFAFKYVIFLLPVLLSCVALGIFQVAKALRNIFSTAGLKMQARLGMAGLALVTGLFGWVSYSSFDVGLTQKPTKWQAIGSLIASNAEPGDAFVTFPVEILTMQADSIINSLQALPDGKTFETVENLAELKQQYEGHERLWVIVTELVESEESWQMYAWLSDQPRAALAIYEADVFLLKRGAEQIDILREAAELQITQAASYGSLAGGFADDGLHEEAIEYYRKAMLLAPGAGVWHLRVAQIYEDLGDQANALLEFNQAIQVEPDNPRFYAALAEFYQRLGYTNEAIDLYAKAIAVWNDIYIGLDDKGILAGWLEQIEILRSEKN